MVLLRRRIACCSWNREIKNSVDFDQPPNGIMTYNGLENCIINANSCDNESECPTDSIDEDDSSCSSSNKSVSSHWAMINRDEKQELDDSESQKEFNIKGKISDVDIMKEKFAKLLLGEDSTGGSKGHSSAFALSNSITKLAGSVFGELWKLEPLSDDKKIKWKKEMEWLLAPTNYMVELVPAKQFDANGQTLEIMRPKAREDVHMNLPALKKLDSMLLETLDAMKNTEFWYEEEGKNESLKESKKWWVPVPQVPEGGLSDGERKKLANHAKLVNQIFKAAKSINETILLEMPMPKVILEALPKSGKASLGDDLYKTLNTISCSDVGMLNSLNLKSDHNALDTINRLEAAIHAWKERILMQTNTKSQARTSWSLKDPSMEIDKIQFFINRAQVLLQQIRMRYPNLPKTFLDVMKIQYGKDIAHAILESYSRVLGNLAFNILTRINDICKENVSINPSGIISDISVPGISARHKMNNIQGTLSLLETKKLSVLSDETNTKSVATTPNRSPWVCFTPPKRSP